jgi:hypothetical protein
VSRDYERSAFNALRNAFTGGRLSIEQPGMGDTPQQLEREQLVRSTVQLADYQLLSSGPLGQRLEFIRVNVPAVVARFGVARLVSSVGWYLREIFISGGTSPVSIMNAPTATAIVSSGSTTRNAGFGPIGPELVITQGDAAAALANAWFLPAGGKFTPPQPIWFPPEFFVELGGSIANTQVDVLLVVSAPTLAV